MNDSEQSTQPPPLFVCPFCGGPTPDQPRCASCAGPLDPLSRQATQNAMGPWFLRDEQQPFRPGCSYDTLIGMIARGKIAPETIMRGPSTAQFWYPARRVPGIAHRLGICHSCQSPVSPGPDGNFAPCAACGADFHAESDRQFLGLLPVRHVPGQPAAAVSHEARPQTPVAHPATPAPVRRSAVDLRMTEEVAALRRRNVVLAAVLGVVGLVALVATAAALALFSSAPAATHSGQNASLPGEMRAETEKAAPAGASGTHATPAEAGAAENQTPPKADSADQPLPKAMEPKGESAAARSESASAEWISLRKGSWP
ncbi:MAG: hypothetical protein U0573_15770 [Phycisphaerales bacterium]|nr:hypothetical protein [Planctomycetota bacterium]